MGAADAPGSMFEEWHATAAGGTERRVTVPGRPEALAGAETVTYATSFEDPREADDDVAVLSLRGLYAGAEVSLTGDRLAVLDRERLRGRRDHHGFARLRLDTVLQRGPYGICEPLDAESVAIADLESPVPMRREIER